MPRLSGQERSFGKAAPRISRGEAKSIREDFQRRLEESNRQHQELMAALQLQLQAQLQAQMQTLTSVMARLTAGAGLPLPLPTQPHGPQPTPCATESASDSEGASPAEPESQLPESIPDSASTDPE